MPQIIIIPNFLSTAIQLVALLILFLVLRHFLWKPVTEFLKKRQDYVMQNMADSEKAKEESDKLKKEYEDKLDSAKQEASEIISSARAYSEDLKAKAIRDSKEEAKKEYEKGIKDLELERQKVLTSVNDDIVDMAILSAQKILKEEANQDVDRKMVESFLADLGEAHE